ncbi:MAG: hypothetical protein Aurels2KO_26250 [Aureliella sp.]
MKLSRILKLLLVICIVFLGSRVAGWYFARRPAVELQRGVAERLEAAGANYYYDFQLQPDDSLADWTPGDLQQLTWTSRWLGSPDWGHDIFYVSFAKFDQVDEQGGVATLRDDVGDQQLAILANLSGLKWLAINGTDVSDSAIAELAAAGNLERLWAAQTRVSDLTATSLSMCPRLEHLSIEGSRVTDEGLATIAKFKNLKVLSVGSPTLTAGGLESVGQIAGLRELHLETPLAGDAVVSSLAGLSKLEFLSLRRGRISAAGLQNLTRLSQLKRLQLDGTPVRDDALAVAKSWPELEHISLGGCPITDRGIAQLSQCKKLKTIVLDGTQCSLSGVLSLFCDALGCTVDEALERAFETTRDETGALRSVDFGGLEIADQDIEAIAKIKTLQWLEMPRNRLTDNGLIELATSDLPSLSLLRIDGASVSPATIRQLGKLPSVRNLHAVGCGLSEEFVGKLRSEYPSLRIYLNKLQR